VSDEAKVRELLAPMDQIPVDLEGRRYRVDRGKVVSTIVRAPALLEERAARARRVQLLSLAAGFALVMGALGLWKWRGPSASIVRDFDVVVVRGDVTQTGGELATSADAEASVRTRDGLQVRLFENGRLKLAELRQIDEGRALHFARGAIECHVPKLPPGQRFSVITPDATVLVHGTTFRVVVSDVGAVTRTCVSVAEGVVTVNDGASETRVEASQSWGCTPPKESSITPPPPAPEPVPKAKDPPPAAESQRPSRGTLKEENRLFQAGLAAEQKGDTRKAAASFSLLLSRYPQSPLAADARAALDRVSKGAP
jgi:hypothetical protein